MMRRIFVNLLCSCIMAGSYGQWEVPQKLILNGTDPNDRSITGLADPIQGTDLVSADAARQQAVIYGTANGTNSLNMNLTPVPAVLTAGMRVAFHVTSTNTGAATLNVNGLGPVDLSKHGGSPLDSADLRVGGSYQALFDGTQFHLLTGDHFECPTGYKAVTRDLCIMELTADTLHWYAASNYCQRRNARLCTMGEWYRACVSDPTFTSTISDFEWVDHAANDNNKAKTLGIDVNTGLPDCTRGGVRLPLTVLPFRCCYSR